MEYRSWGRYPRGQHEISRMVSRHAQLPTIGERSLLPYGNGRSYGDVCQNDGGLLLDARGLDRFIAFDPVTGILRCEAGVLLDEILQLVVPQGWFLPVTPGTRLVTVGGAIANDVHGKNHHKAGTFGNHVRCFELLRSDGGRRVCSPTNNREWFAATIGGLGLTGLITWAEIQLMRIASPWIASETIRFENLDEFFELAQCSDRDYEYTVAWVDCLAKGRALGRGLFMRGNHAPSLGRPSGAGRRQISVPIDLPFSLVNSFSVRVFNSLYYRRQWRKRHNTISHYEPFFYPLDYIQHWNRIYGAQGFLQYQCVIPHEQSRQAVQEILDRIARASEGSFLAVLKVFGDRSSPGLLSFPRPGTTLALDFPNRGASTLALLSQLDDVVSAASGAVYPAKDARMSSDHFRTYFPAWERLLSFRDPEFSSSFWRRVVGEDYAQGSYHRGNFGNSGGRSASIR